MTLGIVTPFLPFAVDRMLSEKTTRHIIMGIGVYIAMISLYCSFSEPNSDLSSSEYEHGSYSRTC